MIKEMPDAERPRERLLAKDGSILSDTELVAVLLRTGHPGKSALAIALEMLQDHGGLDGLLKSATVQSLRRFGVGDAKAASLLAACELARRLGRGSVKRKPMERPAEVVHYLAMRYGQRDQEVMGALFLDVRHHLLGEREVFRGTLSRAVVEPREILKECLLRGAAGVILFHTHPSGDPSPSNEDVLFTRRMAEAATILGVELVDHLVLGDAGRWVSLRERGAW
jgi:DNA repair protein RadC